MVWTLEKEFRNESSDNYINTVKLSGNSVSDTIVIEDDNSKIELNIDTFMEMVYYVDYKTNFLHE